MKVAVIVDGNPQILKERICGTLDRLDTEELELIIPNPKFDNSKIVIDWAEAHKVKYMILPPVKPEASYVQYSKVEAVTMCDVVLVASKNTYFVERYSKARDKMIIYML